MRGRLLSRHALGAMLVGLGCNLSVQAESLSTCYQQALQFDYVRQISQEEHQQAQQRLKQAFSVFLPQVGADFNYLRDLPHGSSGNVSKRYQVGLSQTLFNAPAVRRYYASEQAMRRQSILYADADQRLILRLAQAYFKVLNAQADLHVATAQVSAFHKNLEQMNHKYQVGLISMTDVHLAKAKYDAAISQEIYASSQLAQEKENLSEITGFIPDTLQDIGCGFDPGQLQNRDLSSYLALAQEHNAQLKSAYHAMRASYHAYKASTMEHLPTVNLSAGAQQRISSAITGSDLTPSSGYKYSSTSLGLSASIPLFQGGGQLAKDREKWSAYQAARLQYAQLKNRMTHEVSQAHRALNTAVEQIKARQQAQTSAQSALKATVANYDVGTMTIVDVLNAQSDVLAQHKHLVLAYHDCVQAYLNLHYVTGQLTPDVLEATQDWFSDKSLLLPDIAQTR